MIPRLSTAPAQSEQATECRVPLSAPSPRLQPLVACAAVQACAPMQYVAAMHGCRCCAGPWAVRGRNAWVPLLRRVLGCMWRQYMGAAAAPGPGLLLCVCECGSRVHVQHDQYPGGASLHMADRGSFSRALHFVLLQDCAEHACVLARVMFSGRRAGFCYVQVSSRGGLRLAHVELMVFGDSEMCPVLLRQRGTQRCFEGIALSSADQPRGMLLP
jgi:hypothetical protein